jgi:hypothetical protein
MTEMETETENMTREMERFAVNYCDKHGFMPRKTVIARNFFLSIGCVSYRFEKYGILDHYRKEGK